MKQMWVAYRSNKKLVIFTMVAMMLILAAVPAFAQSTTTIELDASTITPELFRGANIIIGALAAVMFLIAGLAFGSRILRGVVDAVTGFRF